MLEKIKLTALAHREKNYSKNADLPAITQSIAIGMKQLKEFLAQAEKESPGFNALRLYFVRYDLEKDLDYVVKAGNGVSQVSLTIVPVKDFNPDTLKGSDYPTAGDKKEILALSICPPTAGDWDAGTGMCPPKCPG